MDLTWKPALQFYDDGDVDISLKIEDNNCMAVKIDDMCGETLFLEFGKVLVFDYAGLPPSSLNLDV